MEEEKISGRAWVALEKIHDKGGSVASTRELAGLLHFPVGVISAIDRELAELSLIEINDIGGNRLIKKRQRTITAKGKEFVKKQKEAYELLGDK